MPYLYPPNNDAADMAAWYTKLTPLECEGIIADAIEAHDFEGVAAMIKVLAMKDPARAQAVYDTLTVALDVARARGGA